MQIMSVFLCLFFSFVKKVLTVISYKFELSQSFVKYVNIDLNLVTYSQPLTSYYHYATFLLENSWIYFY